MKTSPAMKTTLRNDATRKGKQRWWDTVVQPVVGTDGRPERLLVVKRDITEQRLHEMSYEDLDVDPIGQVRAVYHSLQLPDFDVVEPTLRQYVDSLSGYQKNPRSELPLEIRRRLADEWRFCFDAWGYSDTTAA